MPALLRTPLALAAGLACSALPPALAQTPTDAGRLLQQLQQSAPPTLPPARPPRVVEPPVRPAINMPEGLSVTPSAFKVSGAVSFPAEELAELVKPWVGRKLDINGLNEAAAIITRRYQSAGHLLSYAYVPAQRVADGVIELAVLEGRLEGVQVVTAQEVRLQDDVIQAHTDGLAGKPPLKQADVERKLLLLNDIPGVTARAAFTPGTSAGAADMVVSVAEEEPLVVRLELNNHGSRSTGEVRAGITLQMNDLFGRGDQTVASAMASRRGGMATGSLSTSVPIGGDGYRIGASLSRLNYQLSGPFQAVSAAGVANSAGLNASWPMLRGTDGSIWLRGAYEQKRLRDENITNANPRRSDAAELGFNFEARDRLGGLSAGNVTVTYGRLRLLNNPDGLNDPLGISRIFDKVVGQVARQQPISGPWSLYLRLAGQRAGANLDSSEKFSLGGPSMVRAYGPGQAVVDQGGLAGAELRYLQEYAGGSVSWALFTEYAAGAFNRRPLDPSGNDVRIGGSGLAVQWSGGDIGLAASVAFRSKPALPGDGGNQQPRFFLQMTLTP